MTTLFKIAYALTAVLLIGFAAAQLWEVATYDGNGPQPAFWLDYVIPCIIPGITGMAMLMFQESYRSDDVLDHVEMFIEAVPWPRWSTVVLLGLSMLFAAYAINWQNYNVFTGVVAGMLLFVAIWRSFWRAIAHEQRRVRQAKRQAETEPLPWVL